MNGSLLMSDPGDLKWSVATGDVVFGAPGIGPLGEIVVGSYDGKVHSYNPDGSLRWSVPVASDWIDSSPAISGDGTIYIASWDGYVYALDGNSGALQWKIETGGFVIASPAIGPDGSIYVGSNDGFMYAINSSGVIRWISNLPEISPINSDPVLNHSGDTLYFGTDSGDMHALDTATGSLRWTFSVTDIHTPTSDSDYSIVGAAAVGIDGGIYFGCENTYFYSVDAMGKLQWYFKAEEGIRSSPVISNDSVIHFVAQDGYLYFLDTVGFQIWETFVGDVLYCSPAIDALGNIIVAGYAGSDTIGAATEFTCLNASGAILWEYFISGVNDSSPNIAPDGSIYIGAHDGNLYKLEGYAGLMDGQWPRLQANRRQTGFQHDIFTDELIDYFPLTTSSANGWAFVPWFGSGWLTAEQLPWIRHLEHGLIYMYPGMVGASWFYDPVLADWLYGSSFAPYYYYQYGADSWIFHLPGTSVEKGRWFYDYSLESWKSDPI